jgi:hypothetical protein
MPLKLRCLAVVGGDGADEAGKLLLDIRAHLTGGDDVVLPLGARLLAEEAEEEVGHGGASPGGSLQDLLVGASGGDDLYRPKGEGQEGIGDALGVTAQGCQAAVATIGQEKGMAGGEETRQSPHLVHGQACPQHSLGVGTVEAHLGVVGNEEANLLAIGHGDGEAVSGEHDQHLVVGCHAAGVGKGVEGAADALAGGLLVVKEGDILAGHPEGVD